MVVIRWRVWNAAHISAGFATVHCHELTHILTTIPMDRHVITNYLRELLLMTGMMKMMIGTGNNATASLMPKKNKCVCNRSSQQIWKRLKGMFFVGVQGGEFRFKQIFFLWGGGGGIGTWSQIQTSHFFQWGLDGCVGGWRGVRSLIQMNVCMGNMGRGSSIQS